VGEATIYFMGRRYTVPDSLTVLRALEHVGYRFVRNCGCRGGVCGACAFVYRTEADHRLRGGLACQVTVQDGMHLAFVSHFPSVYVLHRSEQLTPECGAILTLYPEVLRCLGCGQCTQVCPQELDVRHLIALIERGELERAALDSIECIMCGLCTSRCPARIPQPDVFLLARRLYGQHLVPPAPDLARRVAEIEGGMYRAELEALRRLTPEERRARLIQLLEEKT